MPFQSEKALYTDANPVADDWAGQVLDEGDANANFVLVGVGGIISDDDAKKFGIEKRAGVKVFDAAVARDESEARNLATYDTAAKVEVKAEAKADEPAEKPAAIHSFNTRTQSTDTQRAVQSKAK